MTTRRRMPQADGQRRRGAPGRRFRRLIALGATGALVAGLALHASPVLSVAYALVMHSLSSAPRAAAAAAREPIWSPGLSDSLRSGDIVFRRGESLPSRVVLSVDESSAYSHAGVVVMRDGRAFVAHAIPDVGDGSRSGALLEPVEDFFAPASAVSGAVYRSSTLTDGDRERVAASAVAMTAARVPFDDAYAMTSADRVYCTELVWRAFDAAGIDLETRLARVDLPFVREPVLLPGALLQARNLTAVVHLPLTPSERGS